MRASYTLSLEHRNQFTTMSDWDPNLVLQLFKTWKENHLDDLRRLQQRHEVDAELENIRRQIRTLQRDTSANEERDIEIGLLQERE